MSNEIDGDKHGSDSRSQGNGNPKHSGKEVAPCRPFRLWRHRIKLTQRKAAHHNKRYRYSEMPDREFLAALRWLDEACENTRIRISRTGSNAWIAMFTLVLTVTTIAQAYYMYGGMQQTDTIIEQMRLEQRAWLGATQPSIGDFVADEMVQAVMPIKNSGNTPGFVSDSLGVIFKSPKGGDIDSHISRLRELTLNVPRETAVPPGAAIRFNVSISPTLTEDEIKLVKSGDLLLFLYGRIVYTDVSDSSHITEACFVYDIVANKWFAYEKYNHMD